MKENRENNHINLNQVDEEFQK